MSYLPTSVIDLIKSANLYHAIAISFFFLLLLYMFIRGKRNGSLDWTDIITNENGKVSSTKLMQFVGGVTATWVIVKLTLNSTLSPEYLIIFLTYVGSQSMFRRFVGAKYGVNEPTPMTTTELKVTKTEVPDPTGSADKG